RWARRTATAAAAPAGRTASSATASGWRGSPPGPSPLPFRPRLLRLRDPLELGRAQRSPQPALAVDVEPGVRADLVRPVPLPRHVRPEEVELAPPCAAALPEDVLH